MPESFNIVVNTNNPVIVDKLLKIKEESQQNDLAQYLLNLALLQQGMLRGAALSEFVGKTLEKI